MKVFLIFLNICLAGGIFWSVLKEARTPQVNEDEYFFRKTEKDRKKASAKTDAPAPSRKKTAVPETRDSAVSIRKVVEGNIFDPARCPGARIPGRRNANTGLDMTLVGTFTIGELSGAVIMQKRRQQNTASPFPWMQQGMGGMPMAMPAFQNNGQGGGFNNNRQGGGNGAQNNGQGGLARARFGAGDMYARWRRMQSRQQNGGNGNNGDAAVVFQQYVRVGETLANGYKLTAVTRTGATLMKNSEKIELELVEASRNAGADRSRNTNTNPAGFQRGMGMMPWMMPGMMMGGMGGFRGGFQQQNNGGNGRNNARGSSRQQGRQR